MEPTARLFHSRTFRVIGAERFVDGCRAAISDDRLCRQALIGGVDQWSDNTDLRSTTTLLRRVRTLYGES